MNPSMPDERAKRVELILQQLEELPTLPAVAVRVLEATTSPDTSFGDVVDALESDPALTTRILSLVHRADLGATSDVSSIRKAVSLLGFDTVRCAALSVAVFQTLSPGAEAAAAGKSAFDPEEFWKHSIAVACCAELLAKQISGISGTAEDPLAAEAFVAGLLHDIGKIALHTVLPKSFGRVVEGCDLLRGNIADLERSIIGIDHLLAGKRLAERWRLPSTVRDAIWLHGQRPEALAVSAPAGAGMTRHTQLIHLVTLADLLVRDSHLGYSGNYQIPSASPWTTALGLSSAAIGAVMQQLVMQIEPRAAALGLGQATSAQLYQAALARANVELGRMSTRLATRSQRLASRAKFFEHFGAFVSELRPDSTPAAVLTAAGASAMAAIGGDCDSAEKPAAEPLGSALWGTIVAVFSLPLGASRAEVVVVAPSPDEGGMPRVIQTSLIDCPVAPAAPGAGEGPVLPADNLEWLLEVVSPRLAEARRFWIPLLTDGHCVGGVVWGAAAGEAQRLGLRAPELSALAGAWGLALRTAQVRDESRILAEQLSDALRRLGGAQNEIVRSKMLVSVGEMAAGAAHEMNNPLAVISGRSQLLANQLSDPKLKHAATLIHEQSHRLSEIITELMDFARPTPPRPAAVDLADLVGRSLHDAKMLDDPADRKIEVTLTDMPAVLVDESQVSAALTELIGNAIQATDPASGHVEIHASLVPTGAVDAGVAKEDAASGVQQVALTIADNGCGMDEATLKRAFDPFFSAKPAGRRRGLGLAKALRWIESSGGSIRLESHSGSGTRSLVLLPAAPATSSVAEDEIAAASRAARAG